MDENGRIVYFATAGDITIRFRITETDIENNILLEDFIHDVNVKAFTDNDGSGYFVVNGNLTDFPIECDEDYIRKWAQAIAKSLNIDFIFISIGWYNK